MPKVERVFPQHTTNKNNKGQTSIESTIGWDALGLDNRYRVSVYGPPATGKSTFASTFPGPILWLVCSGGKKSGELRSVNTPELRKKIVPKLIKHSSEIAEAAEYARSTGKYETVVLDHASGVAGLVVMELKNLKEAPFAFARSHAQEAKGMTLVSEQEWGFIGSECIKALQSILDLDCHSVIIAQQKETIPRKKENQADYSGEDILMPFVGSSITPMSVGWLNPSVDYILGTFIRPKIEIKIQKPSNKDGKPITLKKRIPGQYEYCLRTGEHDLFTVKLRIPREYRHLVPECIVDPTYDKLVALVNGKYKKE